MNYALVTCSGCGENFREWDSKKASGYCSWVCEKRGKAKRKLAKTLRSKDRKTKSKKVDFYSSETWRAVRYLAIKRSNGACEACGTSASKESPLHVDHIKPRSLYPQLSLALSNLQVLCRDCNLGKRHLDETDWRKP